MGTGSPELENYADAATQTATEEKPRNTTIVFHAKKSKDDKNPSHTLSFMTKDGVLLCVYSRPHPGLESYSKASGRFYTGKRMESMLLELGPEALNPIGVTDKAEIIKRVVPTPVRKTLRYYASCAKKYFKLQENPIVFIRGQFADWQDWMANGRNTRVPIKSVIVTRKLEEL